ncbi:glycoside hydrolase family 35 protein [Pseudacidobacterium ailaaui]|uniref:glycoside hydrolase family 35 protein n=1 Tax=Pseudacidobacterium ailaaui TaxID=1382359 RepID=UPI0005D203B5|nr:beta-galactosidase [Pseudacidobacterium ailaaui]
MKRIFVVVLLCATGFIIPPSPAAAAHSFRAENGQFTLDGQPFQVISGEMHYARIPRAYWRDRLRMAKAMGLNTITTYVFWNIHETSPGVYDFSGDKDVAEFIREAQQEGLYLILRPGPYACAEWDFGGYPAWLLKDHDMVVRSRDPKFLAAARRWMMRLGQELAPLQIGNGGPIILVQVENEYGSFGQDHQYMEDIHQMFVDAGFTRAQLYTADGPEQVPDGSLPELPAAINFGPGESQKGFATLKKLRPDGPWMNSEYWDGWFDHWGAKHARTDARQQNADLDWTLRQGYSISLYMFHGGTSFGWMNGANSNGKNYEPDVTSYDYDAPLDESGRPTPKYFLFRDTIAKATGKTPPPVPPFAPPMEVPAFNLAQSASLWANLPRPVQSQGPLSMEDIGQAYGYILYRTRLKGPVNGDLVLDQLHDYAQIYLDGKLMGKLDRRLDQDSLPLKVAAASAQLDILVENTGRVNFTKVLRGERKGITKQVTLAGKPLTGWEIYSLPMTNPGALRYGSAPCTGACFYRAAFHVEKPADTFLDTSAFTKGEVWLNGHALGRIWNIGPQKTLYVPGPWLKAGDNEVIVFDLDGAPGRSLQGLKTPVLDAAVE